MKFFILATCLALCATSGFGFSVGTSNRCNIINKVTGREQRLDCLLDPEAVIGPYYLPLNISRVDIREGKAGSLLNLNIIVMNSLTCAPIPNAIVDIWHASYDGIYSGYSAEGTAGETWLRGIQVADSNGETNFQTIFPGWYTGRCVHIHIGVYLNGAFRHIGQLFFNDSFTQSMRSIYPYSLRTEVPMWNTEDGIYASSAGASTTFDDPTGNPISGMSAIMYVGVDPSFVADGGDTGGPGDGGPGDGGPGDGGPGDGGPGDGGPGGPGR